MIMPKKAIQITITLLFVIGFILPMQPVTADSIPDSAFISGFVGHAQGHSLSCEARSAADLADFWGVSISENDFLSQLPFSKNPDKGFVGRYDDYWGNIPPRSYGVHAAPIAAELKDLGLQAKALDDASMDDLRDQLAAGHPVIVWVIGQMWNGTADTIQLADSDIIRVAAFEHTMVLTGYTPDQVQVFDPYTGSYEVFGLDYFLASWSVLGNMAVTVDGMDTADAQSADQTAANTPDQTDTTGQDHPATYTVQKDEYLIELGERFGIDWRWLVQINNIPYPWTIYPGQVLQLK
jgi:uncharacterized protein YvpB